MNQFPSKNQPAPRTERSSLLGREQERRKHLQDELQRVRKEKEEAEAQVLRERAEAAEREHANGCRVTAQAFALARSLSPIETTKLVNIVENARRTFRPSIEHRTFDVYAALDAGMAHLRPSHIRRDASGLNREENIQQTRVFHERLRKLGLQNPAVPSVPGGRNGYGL